MAARQRQRIVAYVTAHPESKVRFTSLLDSFEYVIGEEKDMTLLNQLLSRVRISPKIGTACSSIAIGYEDTVRHMTAEEKGELDLVMKLVGSYSKRTRATPLSIQTLRTELEQLSDDVPPEALPVQGIPDADIRELVRIGLMSEEDCRHENYVYNNHKCDVRKDDEQQNCGLNTSFRCGKGNALGQLGCTLNADTSRRTLDQTAKKYRLRKEGRQQVDTVVRPRFLQDS